MFILTFELDLHFTLSLYTGYFTYKAYQSGKLCHPSLARQCSIALLPNQAAFIMFNKFIGQFSIATLHLGDQTHVQLPSCITGQGIRIEHGHHLMQSTAYLLLSQSRPHHISDIHITVEVFHKILHNLSPSSPRCCHHWSPSIL